jgi:hypothetical protein
VYKYGVVRVTSLHSPRHTKEKGRAGGKRKERGKEKGNGGEIQTSKIFDKGKTKNRRVPCGVSFFG